jgi:predicted dienelactone hydrolase
MKARALPRLPLALLVGITVAACARLGDGRARTLATEGLADEGPFGVDTLEFADLADSSRGRTVPIRVHLPTGDGPFPEVVVSHGGGGHWDANYAQASHLASHGYVVLALEHVRSNSAVFKRSFRFIANLRTMTRDAHEVLGRPRDIGFAIDQAERWNETHQRLRGRMDIQRVGVLGHSYGAYTTLAVAGARPALDWLTPNVGPGHGLGPDLRDDRVDCGVALSPQGPGEPFFIEPSYASLATPMLGISGSKDRQQGARPENRHQGYALWPPGDKILMWLEGADHTAFLDATGSGRRMLPSRARDDVQPLVRAATLLFFDAHLKADTVALDSMTADALKPYLRGSVTDVEVLTK